MPFYATPYMVLPLLSTMINGGLAWYAWQRRQIPAAFWLCGLLIGTALWSLCYGLNIAASELWLKNLLFKLGHVSFSLTICTTIPLALVLLGKERWLSKTVIGLLSLEAVISILLVWTNDLHGLFRYNLHLVNKQGLLLLGYVDGPYYTGIHILYVYLYFLSVIALCLWGVVQKGQGRRLSFVLLVIGIFVPLLVDVLHLSPVRELRFATSVTWLSGICYCLAVFRGRLLTLVPLARQTLFEQMQEPVLVVDREGRLAELNRSAADHFELLPDAVGRHITDLFPPDHSLHRLCEQFPKLPAEVTAAGQNWQITSSLLQQSGTNIGQMLVLHNVTALKQAQDELRKNEERFRRLADESADMVWQLDTGLNFTYVNAADHAMRGFTAEEVIGSSALSILWPDDADMVLKTHQDRMSYEQQGVRTGALRYELRMRRKDGSYIWTEVHANPLRNHEGLISGFIGVTRDISNRKAYQELMAEALASEQEMRGEQERFMDMISHEYRTPLAIIQSNIDLLELKGYSRSDAVSEPLKKMNRAVERLIDIFESFRRRKEISQRTLQPELELVDAETCFIGALQAARDFWGDRFTVLTPPPVGLQLDADRHLLRTALMNLFENAVKYSAAGSPITLEVQQSGRQVCLKVHNRSVAPLPQDVGQLFQKYRRGGNSTGTSGTGVGLYLAQAIAEQLGGSLTMQVEKGYDVTLALTLPISSD